MYAVALCWERVGCSTACIAGIPRQEAPSPLPGTASLSPSAPASSAPSGHRPQG